MLDSIFWLYHEISLENRLFDLFCSDSIKTMNVEQQPLRAKVNSHSVTKTQTPAKITTLNDCSEKNIGMSSVKPHKDSRELNNNIPDLNHNTNNVVSNNSIEQGEKDLFDTSANGAGRLGKSALKGISSSLTPRIYKSIGIQVGSENR